MKIKMLKKYSTLFSFFGIVLIFSFIDITNQTKDFSELENRNLSKFPQLTFESYINNSFTTDYETYINDQFILRNNWINLKSKVEYILGKRENNNIIYGKDDFLFEKYQSIDMEMLENNINSIITFAEKYDFNTSFMIIPNSYAIYKELLPRNLALIDQLEIIDSIHYYITLLDNDIDMIDISQTLLEHKNKYIYYRTDHHWTTYGAYLAYCQYIKDKNLAPLNLLTLEKVEVANFLGTYYNKSKFFKCKSDVISYYNLPNLEIEIDGINYDSLMNLDKLQSSDKYSAFLWGNNGFTRIMNNEIPEERKGSSILIFKDSYANSFVQFLSYNYETVDVIDLRHFKEPVSNFMNNKIYNEILIMYNFSNLSSDINIRRLKF